MTRPDARESRKEPRCPACGWHLSFEEHEGGWRGRCWNTSCVRDEVHPPTPVEAEVLSLVERHGAVDAGVLCAELGLRLNTASMRLKTMAQAGILVRERVIPKGGGKMFVYRAAA